MKVLKTYLINLSSFGIVLFCLGFGLICVQGCEGDNQETIVYTNEGGNANVGGNTTASTVSNSSTTNNYNITGTWTGTSGTAKHKTIVTIKDNNGKISGKLVWSWGGVRTFSGTRSGNKVVWKNSPDDVGVVDTWTMTISSDGKKLNGNASKTDGGGYRITLSR